MGLEPDYLIDENGVPVCLVQNSKKTIAIRVRDEDGDVQNISTKTAGNYKCTAKTRTGTTIVNSLAASFVNTGTDGLLQWSFTAGHTQFEVTGGTIVFVDNDDNAHDELHRALFDITEEVFTT